MNLSDKIRGYLNYIHEPPIKKYNPLLFKNVSDDQIQKYVKEAPEASALKEQIKKDFNESIRDFVVRNLDLSKGAKNVLYSTRECSYTKGLDETNLKAIVNFKRINLLRYINPHLNSANQLLPMNGIYIGRVETYWERKINLFNRMGKFLGEIIWLMDFVVNRVIPKMKYLDNIYYFFTNGHRTAISKAEALGRMRYNGFEILDYEVIDKRFYFAVQKKSAPQDYAFPTYRPFVKLNRVGKNGNMIQVYKLRTMHPFSEYLQDHVVQMNGYNEVGKPKDDFRVARWGKLLRKVWLDEFPQIINVLKGEMKLVGIRPLSKARFKEFPADLQKERIKYKPGCFPPYVALCMPDQNGNIEAERIYLSDKLKDPVFTDSRYLMKSVYNIVFNKIRSS